MNKKVLIIAPSKNTRGGITSVLKSYENSSTWKKWNCKWISTYIDKSPFHKIAHFVCGLTIFIFNLPKATIVHIHFSWNVSALRKLPFFLLAKLFLRKTVLHLHSGAEPILNSKIKGIYTYLFKNADSTIIISQTIRNQLIEKFNFKSVRVIYNPCIIELSFEPSLRKNYILFAGSINEMKGVFDLLIAFSKICKKHPSWELLIAGNGNIKKLYELVESLDIAGQIKILGWIMGKEKEKVFKSTSIFCLPSYNEGFPMAVLDAWAYGIPVVTTPVGGLPDVIKHGINAMVFNPGDIENLASNLELLILNKNLRKDLSRASLTLIQETFNINTILKQLDILYNELNSTISI
jgi:glycosyltransferase involved in cell wall biosynthesis